jgi:signal transduction histidine kinase
MEAFSKTQTTELEREKRKNNLTRLLAMELGQSSNLRHKLANILLVLETHLQLRHTMILMPEADGQRLRVVASRGFDNQKVGATIGFGEGVIGVVAQRKQKFRINSFRRQSHYLRQATGAGSVVTPFDRSRLNNDLPGLPDVDSQVAFPLLANDVLVAVLSAESADMNFFSQEDEEFLMTMSQLMALSIQNALIIDQLEEKVRERTAELERRQQELERANASKDRLFGIIGHDLRSPAASLQNVAELMYYYADKGDMDQLTTLSKRVVGAAKNINHLLDNLLNWSIAQTGDLTLQPEPLCLRAILSEVCPIYADNAAIKAIQLVIDAPGDVGVWADRNALLTILRNLLSNALKFTHPGGTVTTQVRPDGECVAITLTDTGVGMAPDRLATLFKLKDARSTVGTFKEKGTGLGLVLVAELVQKSGGTIRIESQPGQGTNVLLHLPMSK